MSISLLNNDYIFEHLWQNSPVAMMMVNRFLSITAANQATCNLLSYNEDDLDGKPLKEFFSLKDNAYKQIKAFLDNPTGDTMNMETRWKTAQNNLLSLHLDIKLTPDQESLIISLTDYTAFAKKDEQIELLESIIDTIRSIQATASKEKSRKKMLEYFCDYLQRRRKYRAVWIAVINSDGKVGDFAEAGLGLFPMEEIIRDGEYCCCIRKAMKENGTILTTNPMTECDNCSLASVFGNIVCMTSKIEFAGRFYGVINIHLSPEKATKAEQDLLQSISKDISLILHSYEAEQTRHEAEEEKEKAKKMKSNFIALASHQLRTPLTTIREGINILLEELAGDLNQEQKNFIMALKRNSDRIDRVVSGILTLQKIETGIISINCTRVSLEDLFYDLEPTISKKSLLNEIKIDYQIADSIHWIPCDKEMLNKAFRIILSKLIEYSEGSKFIISADKQDDGIDISFTTDYTALNTEDIVSYFQKPSMTYRLTHKSDELMIDMSICHEIIKQHNGIITVAPNPEKGVAVHVFIPECNPA